ncbi:MAG: cytidine deaminase [Actinomycetota bacterium]|nr:cytidine deaminase [Actinomycetota bacterium]
MPQQPSDPEDVKIITLARSVRARAGTRSGAAVRDTDGRTYAAADVDLPSLRLSALQLAVAMAASSGVQGLEAVAVVADDHSHEPVGVDTVRDLGGVGRRIYHADASGRVVDVLTA